MKKRIIVASLIIVGILLISLRISITGKVIRTGKENYIEKNVEGKFLGLIKIDMKVKEVVEDSGSIKIRKPGWAVLIKEEKQTEEKVTICHILPDNSEKPITIRVGNSSVQAHLNHGDYLGKCKIPVVLDEKCVELVEGHNNLNENRINLVFVSINRNKEELLENSLSAVDYYGEGDGLMNIEPFKSNKNKFNFWYIEEVGYFDINLVTGMYGFEAKPEINRLANYCNLTNKYPIAFTNFQIANNADWSGMIRMGANPKPKIVVHEFGHSFGLLADERKESGIFSSIFSSFLGEKPEFLKENSYFSENINCATVKECYPGGKCKDVTSCFTTPESNQDCEENSNWKDLLGNGCGEDGVVDCLLINYINVTEEVCYYDEGIYVCKNVTDQILENPDSNIEITCKYFGGDTYIDVYKPSFTSIMLSSRGYFSFGPFNERVLCNKIKELTNSVGGICNNLCLEGCAGEQKCINGACQLPSLPEQEE